MRTLVLLLAGCFEPRLEQGLPCSDKGWCPPPMRCDPISLTCGGNGSDTTPDASISDANLMFVTSTPIAFTSVTSAAIADAHCNTLAAGAGLPGTYIAWLSSASQSIRNRFPATARGWIRTDGKPFADRLEDLLAGKIFYPPSVDENRQFYMGTVATGTSADGSPVDTCNDLSGNSTAFITIGSSDASRPYWTNVDASEPCNRSQRLYCFGTDGNAEVKPPGTPGRWIFLTDNSYTPDVGGAAAFDTACQTEGAQIDPTGTYVALIGISGFAPNRRKTFAINPAKPWVRRDGVVVTTDMMELQAPISVTGQLGAYASEHVMVGAVSLADTPQATETCNDWTSSLMSLFTGLSSRSTIEAFSFDTRQCTNLRLYCAEL